MINYIFGYEWIIAWISDPDYLQCSQKLTVFKKLFFILTALTCSYNIMNIQ